MVALETEPAITDAARQAPCIGLDALVGAGPFDPVKVLPFELSDGLLALRDQAKTWVGYRTALVVALLHAQPLGLVVLDLETADPATDWTARVAASCSDAIEAHRRDDGATAPEILPDLWSGWSEARVPCLEARDLARANGPSASVVVATRERPEHLVRCLGSLVQLEYPDFEIVVVDNAPRSRRTYEVVRAAAAADDRIRYVVEDRPGLGVAHNRALDGARGEIVAITDDDVIVDRYWLAELAAPFMANPAVGAVTGLILPAELETRAQAVLEAHGRYIKGFEPRCFDRTTRPPGDPRFPFTAGTLGAGANMAFATEFLCSRGGFDPALGTGTIARGGDDLAALFDVVVTGRRVAYRPGAMVWHHHHREETAVPRQTFDYAVGLGAYLTAAVVRHPGQLAALLRRLPAGLALLQAREDDRRDDDWPPSLERLARRGLAVGPLAYAASRLAGRARNWR